MSMSVSSVFGEQSSARAKLEIQWDVNTETRAHKVTSQVRAEGGWI
jgi:hypothetical protein